MAKVGKKYAEAAKLFDKQKQYDVAEAIDILKKMDTAKFDETVELAVNLNVDPKYADQQVRGALVLPHGTGKSKTVLVFAQGDKEKEALAAGADYVGADDLVEKIKGGWLEFDVAIAFFITGKSESLPMIKPTFNRDPSLEKQNPKVTQYHLWVFS